MTPIGGSYSDEEFDVLDPMRAATARSLVHSFGNQIHLGCREKWNRGETIEPRGVLVKFNDGVWLEVANHGGGACSTLFLKRVAPGVGWIGTEGKPATWENGCPVVNFDSLPELFQKYNTRFG
jgi:hypothetical protein